MECVIIEKPETLVLVQPVHLRHFGEDVLATHS